MTLQGNFEIQMMACKRVYKGIFLTVSSSSVATPSPPPPSTIILIRIVSLCLHPVGHKLQKANTQTVY